MSEAEPSGIAFNREREPAFSISALAPWDFWARSGAVDLRSDMTQDHARQVVCMAAIALRDREAASERRN